MNKRIRKKKWKQECERMKTGKIILRPDTYTREGWACGGGAWSNVPGRTIFSVYVPQQP